MVLGAKNPMWNVSFSTVGLQPATERFVRRIGRFGLIKIFSGPSSILFGGKLGLAQLRTSQTGEFKGNGATALFTPCAIRAARSADFFVRGDAASFRGKFLHLGMRPPRA